MKFARFEADGERYLGMLSADETTVTALEGFKDMNGLIAFMSGRELKSRRDIEALLAGGDAGQKRWSLDAVRLLAPIERPVHDILCVGVNYKAHLEECEGAMPIGTPAKAVYFSKRALGFTGPGETLDGHLELDACLDYEVELAVIIGKGGRDIPPEQAGAHIFGYTVFNDFSARTLQKSHVQWFRGKSLDGFSAMGPTILYGGDLEFPPVFHLESRVNGELRQSASTSQYIRDIPTLVSQLSMGITLEPGDMIATGTPSGVGMGFDPPRYLKSGDEVACEIDAIGKLCITIK